MQRTIFLPEDLSDQVEAYLNAHREQTLSSLVEQALEHEVPPKDPSAILKLIGLASRYPRRRVPLGERQPEDRSIDRER